MTRRLVKLFFLLLLVPLFATNVAQADELYARIRGTVADATGAFVVGAQVTATNVATGVARQTVTNSTGSFELVNLVPGKYNVVVSKEGFKSVSTPNIPLEVNQVYTHNVALQVGTKTDYVTVEANPAQVDTTSIQLGATIPQTTVTNLPLNGRNWVQLQQTLPGVVLPDTRFGSNYSTNGSQAQQNSYLVNGTDSNDLPLNSPLAPPNPDAIAEVRMVTGSINPEFGRNSGAILNAITKSGTNDWHGNAFEFYRDTSLNTANYFQIRNGVKQVPVFHQNQFGGTIGGPILKNRTFFFFSFQGIRNVVPQNNALVTVYTQAQRDGNFSSSTLSATKTNPFPITGENGTVYPAGTPWRTIFPTGHVPTSDFNSLSASLMNKFVPLPNNGTNQYSFPGSTVGKTNQYLGRLDQTFGPNDTLWFYAYANNAASVNDIPFSGGTLPGFGDQSTSLVKQFTTSWGHSFTGTMLNEFRLGYTRLNYGAVMPQKVVQPKDVGFPTIVPNVPQGAGYPYMGVQGMFALGFTTNGPQPRKDQTYQITDNLSWIKGKHSFKFGYEGRKFQVWNPFGARNSGSFSFNTAGANSTGNAGLDFLLGIPRSYNQQSGSVIIAQAYEHYMYVQDQWKVRDNLTLTFGTGYQIDQPIRELEYGGLARICFRPGMQSTTYTTAPEGYLFPSDATCNDGGGATTKLSHFGPRFGFAYAPNLPGPLSRISGTGGKFSIRGGVGVYYNRSEEELNLQDLGNPPFGISSNGATRPSFPNPFVDIRNGAAANNPFPFVPPPPGTPYDFSSSLPFAISVLDRNATIPYAINYNLTVERELPAHTIARVAYVGSQGRKLWVSRSFNPATPAGVSACNTDPTLYDLDANGNRIVSATGSTCREWLNDPTVFPEHYVYPGNIWGSSGIQYNGGNSNYNSLQVTVDKHFSHGVELLSSYTWAHAMDVGSSFEDTAFQTAGAYDAYGNLRRDYGDSAFDARHRWVTSFSYEIPNLNKLSFLNWMPSRIFGGWRVSGIHVIQTGMPINFQDTNGTSLVCNTTYAYYACPDRPDVVSMPRAIDPHVSNSASTISWMGSSLANHYFDPNSFTDNAWGTQGNTRRGMLHGPGYWNADLALEKGTKLTERTSFLLRAEAFNLFNHTNFANPSGSFASGNFGRVTNIRTNTNSRLVQLAAKFTF